MRWDELFNDLAGQFDAEYERARMREAVDDERLRVARLTLRQRLFALETTLEAEEHLTLELLGGERIAVIPTEFGADWFAARYAAPTRRYSRAIIPLAGINSVLLTRSQIVRSLTALPQQPASLAGRLGLVMPLRQLARMRVHCEISLSSGPLYGTIDRVGRDVLDLAVHEADTPRRDREISGWRLVALSEVRLVRAGAY